MYGSPRWSPSGTTQFSWIHAPTSQPSDGNSPGYCWPRQGNSLAHGSGVHQVHARLSGSLGLWRRTPLADLGEFVRSHFPAQSQPCQRGQPDPIAELAGLLGCVQVAVLGVHLPANVLGDLAGVAVTLPGRGHRGAPQIAPQFLLGFGLNGDYVFEDLDRLAGPVHTGLADWLVGLFALLGLGHPLRGAHE